MITIDEIISQANRWPADVKEAFEERLAIAQFSCDQTEMQAYRTAYDEGRKMMEARK